MEKNAIKRGFAQRLLKAVLIHFKADDISKVDKTKLAKLFSVTSTMAWYYLSGDSPKFPSMSRAIDISCKLGVSVEWLLTGRGSMYIKTNRYSDGAALVATMWDLLPEEEQNKLWPLILMSYMSKAQVDPSSESYKSVVARIEAYQQYHQPQLINGTPEKKPKKSSKKH